MGTAGLEYLERSSDLAVDATSRRGWHGTVLLRNNEQQLTVKGAPLKLNKTCLAKTVSTLFTRKPDFSTGCPPVGSRRNKRNSKCEKDWTVIAGFEDREDP